MIGTTSTIVLTNTLLQGSKKYLEEHTDVTPVKLRNILEESRDLMLESLNKLVIEVKDEDYEKIATVALRSEINIQK